MPCAPIEQRQREIHSASRHRFVVGLTRASELPQVRVSHAVRSATAILDAEGAGGQALGADMSGGPPDIAIFAAAVPTARSEGPRLAAPRACPSAASSTHKDEAAIAAQHMHSRQRMNRFDSARQKASPVERAKKRPRFLAAFSVSCVAAYCAAAVLAGAGAVPAGAGAVPAGAGAEDEPAGAASSRPGCFMPASCSGVWSGRLSPCSGR